MQKARRHPNIIRTPTACKRTVSGTISPSCSEYFSPFPHGTCPLSVSQEYLALPDGAGKFRQDFTGPALLRIPLKDRLNFAYRIITFFDPTFQLCFAIQSIAYLVVLLPQCCRNNFGLGSSAFARHYLRNHYCFLLLRLLRCFSSPGSPLAYRKVTGLQPAGLPHSEISGLTVICTYPKLIAACHVLLRL